jgi:hypothetical protein
MEISKHKTNWFVRTLIIAFSSFLIALVAYKVFYVDPGAEISGGLVLVIAFIVILILSESFNNFSIGEIISMSREVKEKDLQTKDLKTENIELRNQLISISNSINLRQTSTNIIGYPGVNFDAVTVKKAAQEEIENKKNEEDSQLISHPEIITPSVELTESLTMIVPNTPKPDISQGASSKGVTILERRRELERIEEMMISNYVGNNNFGSFNLVRSAKLAPQFSGIDPITDRTPVFDGYINTSESEIFIEVRVNGVRGATMLFDKLYVMLSKINHYKAIKKTNAYLSLLLGNNHDEELMGSFDKLVSEFEPAINSGLLRLHRYKFVKDGSDRLIINVVEN